MASVPTTRRLLLLIPAALVASVGGLVMTRQATPDPVRVARERYGSAALVVPNRHRPVTQLIASSDGLTPPSDDAPAAIARQFVVSNRDVLGLEPNPPSGPAPDTTPTTASTTAPTTASTIAPVTAPPEAPVDDALVELRRGDTLDGQWFRFEQTVGGVPVYGGDIVVTVNDDGQVVSSAVKSAAPLTEEPQFTVTPDDAQQVAVDVAVKRTGLNPNDLAVTTPQPVWFDPTVLAPDVENSDTALSTSSVSARAAYQVNVTSPQGVDFEMVIDANLAVPALVIDHVETVAPRICDGSNTAGKNLTCTTANAEAAPQASTVPEVANSYNLALATSTYYSTQLGRNSYDGVGSPLVATVRACEVAPCPMVNAYWTNDQAVFGLNFATDDIVGHEFTHGLIQTTADLMYYGQSGAINESIADIFGELIDHTTTIGGNDAPAQDWQVGEGVTGITAPIRYMADPPLRSHPDKMTSTYYRGSSADNYGVHANSGVLNKAAYLIDVGGTFNGHTITGLGDVLTGKIFYQALTSTLVPGSDYADLAVALPQACQQLVAANIATATQCQSVTKAVAATEMAKPPTATGATLTAATCDTGAVISPALFSDDAENGLTKWTPSSSVANAAWTNATRASKSGTHSFYGPDVDQPADASLTLANPIVLPSINAAGGDKLFVRFDHTFGFERDDKSTYFDGGVVEYELNGNGAWQDVKALPSINGYNGVLANPASPANPLAGRSAFVAVSPGFQTTRIDLTSLAGQSLKLRFRIGSDNHVGDYGWNIDDVQIYRCATNAAATTAVPTTILAPTTTLTATPTTATPTTAAPTTATPTTAVPATTAAPTPTTMPRIITGSGGATTNEGAQRGPGIQVG